MNRSSTGRVHGLRFRVNELVREAQALQSIGRDFFEQSTGWALDRFISQLQSIWSATAGKPKMWKLNSLRTIGACNSGTSLHAEISGIWELTPLGNNSPKPKERIKREVAFSGIASTKFELYSAGQPERIAMWRIELGAADSPGCYFHTQILGDSENPPFPKTVKIPRLPSFFVTPMAAIDYVLGELFGHEWERSAEGMRGDARFWRHLQCDRLNRQFEWYLEELTGHSRSPWMALKGAKPESDMFQASRSRGRL